VSNPETRKLVEGGVTAAAIALGLPTGIVTIIADLLETLVDVPDAIGTAQALKQNALADAEDLAAETAADLLLTKRKP